LKTFPIALFFLISAFALAQEHRMQGIITDSIPVDAEGKESYCLYRPSGFDPAVPAPVVFIFDPSGRGRTGITPFIQAADNYGYLLICSNNSRNGPIEKNFGIAERLFRKVLSEYPIRKDKMYLAGFSGGGRLSTALAISSGLFQGVVSCGAGLSINSGFLPTTEKFSFAAIIGDEDMNFSELHHNRKYLKKIGLPNEIFTFSMDHRWPDQQQMLLAFDWLELEAYRKGISFRDTSVVHDIYRRHYQLADDREAANELLGALDGYQWILRNLSRYYRLDSIAERADRIQKGGSYLEQSDALEKALIEEKEYTEIFVQRFHDDLAKKEPRMDWWEKRLARLKEKEQHSGGEQRKMYHRLSYKVFAWAIERAMLREGIETTEQLVFCYDLCIAVYPQYHYPYLQQIENAMTLNDEEMALGYLEKLLQTGFRDKEALNGLPSANRLKNIPGFLELTKDL